MTKFGSAIPAAALVFLMTACGSSNDNGETSGTTGGTGGTTGGAPSAQDQLATATPIKHLVVIFGENVSFDHYFATYPTATNANGEPAFNAASGTPTVNGLSGSLLTANPNFTNTLNDAGAANPFRLDRAQAYTSDMNHGYTAEQSAYDNGASDLFPLFTGVAGSGGSGAFDTTGLVMGYFDGNTVTALWNYAQRFAMSDNSYGDMYGPSTVGAINVISGQTNDVTLTVTSGSTSYWVDDGQGGKTLMGDVDPGNDICSSTKEAASLNGKHIGDLLTASSITWGAFQGGFDLTLTNPNGTTGCKRSTYSEITAYAETDFIPHHAWFQYYASTNNPSHTRPSSVAAIGTETDGAKHEYDIHDWFDAVKAGNYPSVSYLKAPGYQDGHAGYSDPLDEQAFVTKVVNTLEQLPDWNNTAVIVAYDDSDGWYDHAGVAPTNGSFSAADAASGAGKCGTQGTTTVLPGVSSTSGVNGRCSPGVRQPFLVISPWAKKNYVDHTLTTQASVVTFIEDNWLKGARIGQGSFDATTGKINGMFDFTGTADTTPLYLDNELGTPLSGPPTEE